MSNKIYINQPAGLGDIFFCQKIAEVFAQSGCDVYWPVLDNILWVKEYLQNSKKIHYLCNSEFINDGTYTVVTLDNVHSYIGGLIMMAKYNSVSIDWTDWINFFNFSRNPEKENYLYYDVLNLKDGEEFIFINKEYGTPPGNIKFNFNVNSNIKIVENTIIDGITIFDWCKVIENASRIEMIDTSFMYIIEKLTCKADMMKCYLRHDDFTYMQIKDIFHKNWKYFTKGGILINV